jgi:hypothetical protein
LVCQPGKKVEAWVSQVVSRQVGMNEIIALLAVEFKISFGHCFFSIPGVCLPGIPLRVVQVSMESQRERGEKMATSCLICVKMLSFVESDIYIYNLRALYVCKYVILVHVPYL